MFTLTVLATLFPVVYYIYVGLRRDSRPRDLNDYFIYDRRVSAKDFANTSIGYSLQMAALFLFADWGIRYGFGAFWVPVFWGLGFLFISLLVPKFDRFISANWTLHGYLHEVFRSRALQVVAATATIIGLWGTMMVEVDYATTIYQPFFATDLGLYLLGILFLCFAFLYITYGGYKAEVNTERVQVPVAYVTLLTVVLSLVLNVYFQGYVEAFWILNGLLFLLFLLMILAKVRIAPKYILSDRQLLIPIIGIGLQIAMLLVARFTAPAALSSSSSPFPSMFADLPRQVYAQGIISLISLFLANALWQFVDISNWQRLSSVQLAGQNDTTRYDPIRRGIWRVMIESPVSWGFGVVFGMALRYSGFLKLDDDPSVGVSRFVSILATGQSSIHFLGPHSWVLYPVFAAAVIAIMLSTVTALLSAITYTAFHDLPPFGARTSLTKARAYTIVIAICGAFVYYTMRHIYGVGIQTALYTFYSSQLALFSTVFASFFKRWVSAAAALTSILIGIASTFFAAMIISQLDPNLALIPPLFTVVISGLLYVMMAILRARPAG